jgi:geranylgeranyl reductase family protein
MSNSLIAHVESGKNQLTAAAVSAVSYSKANPFHVAGFLGAGLIGYYGIQMALAKPPISSFEQDQALSRDIFDVAIVGAGPSGSTCGYYLAKYGKNVLLLDKAVFPRDKYCGDAVTYGAQLHMHEMGALQEILRDGEGHWANSGGFVSTTGVSFVGNSAEHTQEMGKGRVIAIKRIHMDEKIARGAKRAGAHLTEDREVVDAAFDAAAKVWTVTTESSDKTVTVYKARVLVCADGAPSRLARKLGLVNTEPEGVCSRSFVKGGTHNFKCDGVVFYTSRLLPGYSAIFRHPNDELNFCTYIIPGGPCKNEDLREMHDYLATKDEYVSRALGPSADMETMRAGPLRLGGIPKSYADNLLIIGDAAGHIDPLTGEGIQYAMDGAKLAADALKDAFAKNDLSSASMKRYHDAWMKLFGHEFYWSMKMSLLLYRFPIMLDAAASVIHKRGAKFLAEWALVMTGGKSKLWFLRPDVGLLIGLEALRLSIYRAVTGKTITAQ